jgi:hypothetical protein
MFHPRSAKKKIDQIARTLEVAAQLSPARDAEGFWTTKEAEPRWPQGVALAEKLREGLAAKSFALSEADSAAIVHALEYVLINACDNRTAGWNDELEKLHNETAKQFVAAYGHSPYANE